MVIQTIMTDHGSVIFGINGCGLLTEMLTLTLHWVNQNRVVKNREKTEKKKIFLTKLTLHNSLVFDITKPRKKDHLPSQ